MSQETQTGPSGGVSLRLAGLQLLAASFVVLFQELALIRWLPVQVRVVAYFPNLILISAFLGLGVGALRSHGRSLLWVWPPALIAVVSAAVLMSGIAFTDNGVGEHLWLLYFDLGPGAPVVDGVRLPLVVLFVLSAVSFVPLGQLIAQRLDVFRAQSSALWGYSIDLVGSLLGVIGFAVASFTRTFPAVWFALFGAVAAVLFVRGRRTGLAYAGFMVLLLVLVSGSERGQIYSPYYSLSVRQWHGDGEGIGVYTNGSFHQLAFGVAAADSLGRPRNDPLQKTRDGYHLPYRLLDRPLGKVLVLGAGTGNDVATLLDEGAAEIHAVEIDPIIQRIGRELHPDDPYSSPRVTVLNTDARSHLNDTDELYDLVVFGTLDSMTRLSALSNVRLDNFVYTREAIDAARSRLAPDGGLVMYFMVGGEEHIHRHLTAVLESAFGEPPLVAADDWMMFNYVYMTGPAFEDVSDAGPILTRVSGEDARAVGVGRMPTDDWPYLYLPGPGVSGFYLSLMAVFMALSVLAVLFASPDMRRAFGRSGGADWEMFLFGVAFLVIETKFITAMSLVWGATWVTSAVVFGSILAMILVGTVLMELKPMGFRTAAVGLVASLLVTFVVPTGALVGHPVPLRLALSVLLVGTPIFFAAACFALRFRTRESVGVAFGWNLLGAVAGGLLEFTSMAVGLRMLSLGAVAAYLVVFWLARRSGTMESRGATV